MIALLLAVVLTLALPAAAGAATVSVEPYVEPPQTDSFGSCSRYMMCPVDMIVVAAGPNENNAVVITAEGSVPAEGGARPRSRFIVRDRIAQMHAGPGCSQVDFTAVSCTAEAVGPVRLGDGHDWFASALGATEVHGGAGQDVLQDLGGYLTGGDGDDVIAGSYGTGGGGDDVLTVRSGVGGSGDDVLRCFPRNTPCTLRGGTGDDLLTGGTSFDRIFGRSGDDRLLGGADGDFLHGGAGADALVSREDRSAGQRIERDSVDCGRGRRDRAVADRRDEVRPSCERVALPR